MPYRKLAEDVVVDQEDPAEAHSASFLLSFLEIKHMILKDPGENRAFATFLRLEHHKRGSKELKEG